MGGTVDQYEWLIEIFEPFEDVFFFLFKVRCQGHWLALREIDNCWLVAGKALPGVLAAVEKQKRHR